MMASEAPNIYNSGVLKMLKMTVSVTDSTRSMEKQLPRIFSAPSRLPAPSWMEASGAPPIPANAAKAETSRMMGNVTPTPVSASAPGAGDVADVDPVHDIVQHVDELRGNGRQGKTEHQLANGLCAQRFVLVLQKNLSF